ncbi:MAG: thioredoxin domain-containing protein [Thermomicrobiales bacterium]
MIERAVLALVIVAVVSAAGYALRSWATWRRRRLIGLRLEPSASAAPRVIAFSSPGCVSCRRQRRVLDAALAEWAGAVEISYVDAVAEPELARRLGVVVVPTTVVAAPDGRVVGITGDVADVDHLLRQLCEAAA